MGSASGSNAGDMVAGAAVGAPFGGLWKYGVDQVIKACKLPGTRKQLKKMLDDVDPLVEEIKRNKDVLDQPQEEIKPLTREMEASKKLVKRKNTWYKFPTFGARQEDLQEKVDLLPRATTMGLLPQVARDVQKVLINTENTKGIAQMKSVCGTPQKPKFTVGVLRHLKNLKTKFLAEDASVVVLTGLGGSGKTTLAIEFCWDPDVRDKFRENIFFLTFTKNPNLRNIIQKLFDHCGCKQMCEFQSDEEAINKLGILLGQKLKDPKLLVLDDVWPGSEYLVEKLKDQLSDCKILVTSRITYPRFGTPYPLGPLRDEDALELFNHLALNDSSSYKPKEDIVQEVVKGCKGSPLALKVISGSLCNQPSEAWLKRREFLKIHSTFESDSEFQKLLKECLDSVLAEMPVIKDCFMDLGLFPEDQGIPVAALIDMWAELHGPDENNLNAANMVNELAIRNLANVVVTRNVESDSDEYKYYNNHFVKLHDHLRDLAIYLSEQGAFEQRKKLIIDISGENRPGWWMDETQPGMISRIWSLVAELLVEQKRQQVIARILSITTDKTFTSDSCRLQPDEAEVLILNLFTANYSFPAFLKKVGKLKVLIVTNYGSHLSEMNKFELLSSFSDLKRIRLEKVVVPPLCKLKNLQKLSLFMCNVNQAFQSCTIQISEALPNLVEFSIDYCNDLVQFPAGFCDIKPLKKLNITNCHMLSALPQDIGKLERLEVLRLSSCTELEELPGSITRLSKLKFLDISDCIKLGGLPDNIGKLRNLRKICMRMGAYSRLREVPDSVVDLVELKRVVCDKETANLWEDHHLLKEKIEVPTVDNNLNWLFGHSSS